ncbi:MAG: hypothetical protein NVSMB3_01380 [Acidobacteriaceae bacterium]
MLIHLSAVAETELTELLPQRARLSTRHTLTSEPGAAEMILLVGSFGLEPEALLEHPLYRAYPEKCAVYTEDDNYLPLAPGVYCSAHVDEHSRAGRTFSYSYVSRAGQYSNQYVTGSDTQFAEFQEHEKTLLFSFQGGSTSLLRKRLFNLPIAPPGSGLSTLIENTSEYYHWDLERPGRADRQQRYAATLAASHFVLCPRGAGTGSIRLFEVMSAGVAPVLISDDYLLPPHVDWDRFLLQIPEKEIGRLPGLLEAQLATAAERGRRAREAWVQHFAPEKEFDAIVASCVAALQHGPPAEAEFQRVQKRLIGRSRLRRKVRSMARNGLLRALKLLHIKNPYQMNR